MKKNFIRFIALILVVGLMASVFIGCKDDNEQEIVGPTNTGEYIVKDGATSYKIVIPQNASERLILAKDELVEIFEQATSLKLEVINDKDLVFNDNVKYLSIGKTTLLEQSKINIDKSVLGTDGVRLVTKGNTVFMCGAGDNGTLYSVYEFLSQTLNFEMFAANTMRLNKDVKNLELMKYDFTDVPDFKVRVSGTHVLSSSKTLLNRWREINYLDSFAYINGREVHNTLSYLPISVYYKDHPSWFSKAKNEICFSANGNAAEHELMTSEVAKIIEAKMSEPNNTDSIFTFTQQDGRLFCQCDTCKASREKYGANSALMIKFCNIVNAKVKAWMLTDEGKAYARDFKILFFAYNDTIDAPVKLNAETNTYYPIDETVICDDGVELLFAPIHHDYTASINDDVNKPSKSTFLQWKAVSSKINFWLYSTNFHQYLVPYDNFAHIQELYQYCNKIGDNFMFDQGQTTQSGGATGWHRLKVYINSKLMWNVNANVEQLIVDYFNACYGDASETMLSIFNEFRVHSAVVKDTTKFGGASSIYMEMLNKEYWSKSLLLKFREDMHKSLESIKHYEKTDYEKYYTYNYNIVAELISVDYLLISVFESAFDKAGYDEIFEELKESILHVGLTKHSEFADIADILNK